MFSKPDTPKCYRCKPYAKHSPQVFLADRGRLRSACRKGLIRTTSSARRSPLEREDRMEAQQTLEAEAIEQRLSHLAVRPSSTKSPVATTRESAPNSTIKRSFSTQFVASSRLLCANTGHSLSTWRNGQIDPKRKFVVSNRMSRIEVLSGHSGSRRRAGARVVVEGSDRSEERVAPVRMRDKMNLARRFLVKRQVWVLRQGLRHGAYRKIGGRRSGNPRTPVQGSAC